MVEQLKARDEKLEDVYDVKEELGRGQFAVVKRCISKETDEAVAAKFVKVKRTKSSRNGLSRELIEREASILKSLEHEKVLKLHDVFDLGAEMCLVLELLSGGELFDKISEQEYLTEVEAGSYMKQVLEAISYLHAKSIVHLDIKPENIVLKEKDGMDVKLVDFGLAQIVRPADDLREMMGTPEFVAPEVINYDRIGLYTDMWAIGVLAYILLSGCSPFLGDDNQETYANICQVDYHFDEEYFDQISEEAKVFVQQLLIKNPKKRNTAESCLDHPWIRSISIPRSRQDSSVIQTGRFKAFQARRRWQQSFQKMKAITRFSKFLKIKAAVPPDVPTKVVPDTEKSKEIDVNTEQLFTTARKEIEESEKEIDTDKSPLGESETSNIKKRLSENTTEEFNKKIKDPCEFPDKKSTDSEKNNDERCQSLLIDSNKENDSNNNIQRKPSPNLLLVPDITISFDGTSGSASNASPRASPNMRRRYSREMPVHYTEILRQLTVETDEIEAETTNNSGKGSSEIEKDNAHCEGVASKEIEDCNLIEAMTGGEVKNVVQASPESEKEEIVKEPQPFLNEDDIALNITGSNLDKKESVVAKETSKTENEEKQQDPNSIRKSKEVKNKVSILTNGSSKRPSSIPKKPPAVLKKPITICKKPTENSKKQNIPSRKTAGSSIKNAIKNFEHGGTPPPVVSKLPVRRTSFGNANKKKPVETTQKSGEQSKPTQRKTSRPKQNESKNSKDNSTIIDLSSVKSFDIRQNKVCRISGRKQFVYDEHSKKARSVSLEDTKVRVSSTSPRSQSVSDTTFLDCQDGGNKSGENKLLLDSVTEKEGNDDAFEAEGQKNGIKVEKPSEKEYVESVVIPTKKNNSSPDVFIENKAISKDQVDSSAKNVPIESETNSTENNDTSSKVSVESESTSTENIDTLSNISIENKATSTETSNTLSNTHTKSKEGWIEITENIKVEEDNLPETQDQITETENNEKLGDGDINNDEGNSLAINKAADETLEHVTEVESSIHTIEEITIIETIVDETHMNQEGLNSSGIGKDSIGNDAVMSIILFEDGEHKENQFEDETSGTENEITTDNVDIHIKEKEENESEAKEMEPTIDDKPIDTETSGAPNYDDEEVKTPQQEDKAISEESNAVSTKEHIEVNDNYTPGNERAFDENKNLPPNENKVDIVLSKTSERITTNLEGKEEDETNDLKELEKKLLIEERKRQKKGCAKCVIL